MKSYYNEYLIKADFADKFGNFKLSDIYYNKALRLAAKPPLPTIFAKIFKDAAGKPIPLKNISDLKAALKRGFLDPSGNLDPTNVTDAWKALGLNDTDATQFVLDYTKITDPIKKAKYLDDMIDDITTQFTAKYNNPKLYAKVLDWFKQPGNATIASKITGYGALGTGGVAGILKWLGNTSAEDADAKLAAAKKEQEAKEAAAAAGSSGGSSGVPGTPGSSGPGTSGRGRNIYKGPDGEYLRPDGMYLERMNARQQQLRNDEANKFIQDNKDNQSLKSQRDWRNKAIVYYMNTKNLSADDNNVLNFANDVSALIKKDKPNLPKDAPIQVKSKEETKPAEESSSKPASSI